jgi:predicted tellurium resistance membrane protein TerC
MKRALQTTATINYLCGRSLLLIAVGLFFAGTLIIAIGISRDNIVVSGVMAISAFGFSFLSGTASD